MCTDAVKCTGTSAMLAAVMLLYMPVPSATCMQLSVPTPSHYTLGDEVQQSP